jgi:hypothetical protein
MATVLTKSSLYILFSLLITAFEAFGQLEQPDRIEIILEQEDDYFQVLSAEEKGIILYREVRNRETRMERKYQVVLIDSALNKKWENTYYVHLKYLLRGFEYFGNHFYLLFQRNTESLKADLYVMRIDLTTKANQTFLIERDYAMELTEFEVLGNSLIFGGYTNNMPTLIRYEFGKSQVTVLPGIFTEKSEIEHLEVDDDLMLINVLTSFRTKDGGRSLSLKTFSEEGELLKNVNLQPSAERSLLFGRTVKLAADVELIVGTYTRKRSELSRGIFLARIAADGEQVINYYNYADLKNFFSYMKAKRQKRIEERIKRRKVKGKKNKFNYRLLVHEVVERDGRFIMVGEAFYPRYSQSSYYGGYYGVGNYNTFFEGYRYTHAVVFGFDRRGRLIWDNSFEINDIESYTLDQYVHISSTDEEMALIYLFENEIRTKVIRGNEVLEGKTFNELKLTFEDDVLSNEENEYGGLERWYGGNLFAYGVHKIKNLKDDGVRLNREVFFINKLRYR